MAPVAPVAPMAPVAPAPLDPPTILNPTEYRMGPSKTLCEIVAPENV